MAPCCRVLWPPDPVPHAVNCAATYKQYVFTGGSNGTLVRSVAPGTQCNAWCVAIGVHAYTCMRFTLTTRNHLCRWLQNESGEGFKPCLMLLGHDAGIVHMAIVPKGVCQCMGFFGTLFSRFAGQGY